MTVTYVVYTMDACDGSTLYGEGVTIPYRTQVSPGRIGPTPACRIDLATGQAETFVLEPTEHYLAGFDGALLTCRYVADAPLPTDAEQYAAAIQSATVEILRDRVHASCVNRLDGMIVRKLSLLSAFQIADLATGAPTLVPRCKSSAVFCLPCIGGQKPFAADGA